MPCVTEITADNADARAKSCVERAPRSVYHVLLAVRTSYSMYDTVQCIPGAFKVNYPTSCGHLVQVVSAGKLELTGPSSKIGSRAYHIFEIKSD